MGYFRAVSATHILSLGVHLSVCFIEHPYQIENEEQHLLDVAQASDLLPVSSLGYPVPFGGQEATAEASWNQFTDDWMGRHDVASSEWDGDVTQEEIAYNTTSAECVQGEVKIVSLEEPVVKKRLAKLQLEFNQTQESLKNMSYSSAERKEFQKSLEMTQELVEGLLTWMSVQAQSRQWHTDFVERHKEEPTERSRTLSVRWGRIHKHDQEITKSVLDLLASRADNKNTMICCALQQPISFATQACPCSVEGCKMEVDVRDVQADLGISCGKYKLNSVVYSQQQQLAQCIAKKTNNENVPAISVSGQHVWSVVSNTTSSMDSS